MKQERHGVVSAAEDVVAAWHEVKIFHGNMPVEIRQDCRRICRDLALSWSRSGDPVTCSFMPRQMNLRVGPPASYEKTENLLFALRSYVTSEWKILRT